ncbi:hypothetical protein B0H17DRAFT_1175142 [Mycena rosella]|uniref:Uncharacterized protein n=1 Tax=Mycena rosella TaxID=1033263 RepID=A0AAD7GVZ5_MYCRO|nr:hypothetical protein B0H17DRAFT_1175142 [Mycena rosella]
MARLVTALGLLGFACSSALCEHLRPRPNQLKPFSKSLNLIPGLLFNRASPTCASCPIGGVCCSGGGNTAIRTQTIKAGTSTTVTVAPTSTKPAGATSSHSALSSVPTPTAGSYNIVVDMSTATLAFSGQWESSSWCNSSATSKTMSSDGSTDAQLSAVSYSFRGSAIYMSLPRLMRTSLLP